MKKNSSKNMERKAKYDTKRIAQIQCNDAKTVSEKFELTNNEDDTFISNLAMALKNNTFFTALQLVGPNNTISSNGWKMLFGIVGNNNTLQTIELTRAIINFECVQLLATMVLSNSINNNNNNNVCSSLTHLSLRDNKQIGFNGLTVLIDALIVRSNSNSNATITHLNLNRVMDSSNCNCNNNNDDMVLEKQLLATKFVTLLQNKTTSRIIELDLSNNPLGDEFITIFVTGLKNNTTLQKLAIESMNITSIGAIAFANVLYYNNTLKDVSIRNNSITDNGINAITHSLRYHPTIRILNVQDNLVSSPNGEINSCQFLKYNESITLYNFLTFNQHLREPKNKALLSKLIDSIVSYNDTVLCFGSLSADHLLKKYNTYHDALHCHRRSTAPKKGVPRRQDIYLWLLYNDYWKRQ